MGSVADVRFALRRLRRSPGFTAVALATLALGIGANAAIFGIVDRVLLRPPPFRDPDRLLLVWNTLGDSPTRVPMAGPDAAVLAERAASLEGVAFAVRAADGAIEAVDGAGAEPVTLTAVSEGFFEVLGVEAARGRTLAPGDGDPSSSTADDLGATAAVITDGLWRRVFGAAPDAVGRDVLLNGFPVRVVGILPAGFRLRLPPDAGVPMNVDVWTPLRIPLTALHRDDGRLRDQDSDNSGAVVARLRDGASLSQARAEMDRIAEELRRELPSYAEAELGITARSLQEDATAHARGWLGVVAGGVGLLFLVACLNITTLLLARGAGREAELAVRSALGAGRWRVARQLAVEGVVLAALGAVAGLTLAPFGGELAADLAPASLGPVEGGVDGRVLAFTVGATGLAALLLALFPAAQAALGRSGTHVGRVLTTGARATGRSGSALVVAEVALTVLLALGTGLLARTVTHLRAVDPGFQAEGALAFRMGFRVPDRYRGPADRARFVREMEERLGELPGVHETGTTGHLPLSGRRWVQPYGLPGQAEAAWSANRADFRMVTSGFFGALGTRLLEGRAFTRDEDLSEERRVVIVDEVLARRLAPDGSAVGHTLGIPLDGSAVEARIVGVVEHIRYDALDDAGREAIYVPYRQEASRDVSVVLRTEGDPAALAPAVRRVMRELDPQLPVFEVATLKGYVETNLAPVRFALTLAGTFAVLALLCAALGLYGVVALDVGRRRRDLGVRMAVGATAGDVVRWVLGRGLRLGGLGLAAGIVLAALASGAFEALLFGVDAADPATWAGVVGTVTLVTLTASALPAWRAGRVDARESLRAQ